MVSRASRMAAFAAVVSLVVAVGCQGREEGADTTGATTQVGATTGAAATMSDGNIVALFDEVNIADSASGALAATKATRAEVKQYAQLMVSEHHALREKGLELARKPSGALPPWPKAEAPAQDPFKPAIDAEMSALSSTPKGAAFDSVYIANEIAIHQAVLDWATQALAQAQNQDLKGLIQSTGPVIQKHLDQAKAIQAKLGGGTGTKTP